MKTVFFDCETSGTDDKKNGILQLAGEIEMNEKVVETFDYFMQLFPGQEIEDSALKANGIKREDIPGFGLPQDVYVQFTSLLVKYIDKYDRADKFTLIGYNSRFDDGFLRQWFANNNDKYYGSYFHWPSIDVSNMVAVKYREYRHRFDNFQLMTVAKKLNIYVNEKKAHNALYDADITKRIFKKCIS